MQPVDRRRLQAVAVAQALVAVDRDSLFRRDRAFDPFHGLAHVREQEGIVKIIHRRIEKLLRRVGIAKAAQTQQSRDRGVKIQRRAECLCLVVITR